MQRDKLRALYRQLQTDPLTRAVLATNKRLARRVVLWLLLEESLLVAQVYPLKYLYNGLTAGQFDRRRLLVIALIMTGVYMAVTVVRRYMDTRRHEFYFSVWSMLWGHGHRAEQRQSVAWHTFHSTGEKQSIMSNNVSKVDNLIALLGRLYLFAGLDRTLVRVHPTSASTQSSRTQLGETGR